MKKKKNYCKSKFFYQVNYLTMQWSQKIGCFFFVVVAILKVLQDIRIKLGLDREDHDLLVVNKVTDVTDVALNPCTQSASRLSCKLRNEI